MEGFLTAEQPQLLTNISKGDVTNAALRSKVAMEAAGDVWCQAELSKIENIFYWFRQFRFCDAKSLAIAVVVVC